MRLKLNLTFVTTLLILFLSYGVTTIVFRTKPTSDFLYYWILAHDASVYHKGGVLGILYSPLTNIPAYWAAFTINGALGAAAIVCLWAFARSAPATEPVLLRLWSGATLVLAILACAPMAPVVSTDLPSLFLFVIGLSIYLLVEIAFVGAVGSMSRVGLLALAGLALGTSASLRQTYIVIAFVLLPTIAFVLQKRLRQEHTKASGVGNIVQIRAFILSTLLVLIIATTALITFEFLLLRASKARDFAPSVVRSVISTGHNLTQDRSWCGGWSMELSRVGRQRATEPLLHFTWERMRSTGWSNLPVLYRCKLRRFLGFAEFGAEWALYAPSGSNELLAEAINVPIETINSAATQSEVLRSPEEIRFLIQIAPIYLSFYETIGTLLKAAAAAMVIGYSLTARRTYGSGAGLVVLFVAALPFFALVGLHVLLFEVQARYALPMWLLPPLSGWLAYRCFQRVLPDSRVGGV
ncbi:hypothetical protein [Microvirga sp. Mcv34]|uniref:hypothetical protein n=1 Tax=Microvirga sp. Mcv34 TaxID=2926016 RepID=UPI0021C5C04D|nr:hypothetical protein [Microvirga sp. Mcv34]